MHDGVGGRISVDEAFIHRGVRRLGLHADARSGVGLRVGVDKEHTFAVDAKAGAEVESGGGFAHAALLVCYCYYSSHDIMIGWVKGKHFPECKNNKKMPIAHNPDS